MARRLRGGRCDRARKPRTRSDRGSSENQPCSVGQGYQHLHQRADIDHVAEHESVERGRSLYDNEIGTDRKGIAGRQAGDVQRRRTGRAAVDDDLVGNARSSVDVERNRAPGRPCVVAGNREPVSRNVVLQIDEAGIGQRAVDGRKTAGVQGACIDGRDGSDRPARQVDDSTRTVGEGTDIVEDVERRR